MRVGARGVGAEKKGIRLESESYKGRKRGSGHLAKSHPDSERVEPSRREEGAS